MRTVAISLLACAAISLSAAGFRVHVQNGDVAHEHLIVSSAVPASFPAAGTLVSGAESVPFQRNPAGEMVFVLPRLAAGEAKVFTLDSTPAAPRVSAELHEGAIVFRQGGKQMFVYQGHETTPPRPNINPLYRRGAYIHPVYSPSGRIVTDHYPADHLHHQGIWFPWTRTRFEDRSPDFWNMGQGTGKVEFDSFVQHWSGAVHAGVTAKHRFVDLQPREPRAALDEVWQLTAYALPGAGYFAFDLVSTQTCATASPLKLPKYHYGGLGFRGNWAWNGEERGRFLTANGETNRVTGNETRANWCHIGGEIEGELTGIAILGHPSNFRAPQPMRIHPKEPFFCFAPSQLGDWEITPGTPYVSRYRFIVLDGAPDQQRLDRLWAAYAQPPRVRVEPL